MGRSLNRLGVALAISLIAAPAFAEVCGGEENYGQELRERALIAQACAITASEEFISSGESPNDIAIPSLTDCEVPIADVRNYVSICRNEGVVGKFMSMIGRELVRERLCQYV